MSLKHHLHQCNHCHSRILMVVFLLLTNCILVFAQNKGNIERKQLFDYNWKFSLGDNASAKSKDFDDKDWRNLDLPHDWSIEAQINPKNPSKSNGGYFQTGLGWYRKTFNVPAEWKGNIISIYFEGAYMNSEVFVNGKSLGIHPYGYTPFSYDLSPYLDYGKENVIAVRIDNSQQMNSRWYSGSGINRHVWMIVTNPLHVAQWGVAVTTPDVSAKKATVQIKTLVKNETAFPQSIVLKTQLWTGKSKNAGNQEIKAELLANSEKEISQTFEVSNPKLWTPETPNLYVAEVNVLKGKKVLDNIKTNLGIRSLKYSADKGFELNGKSVQLNGGCAHHDNACLGAAAYDRAEERKVEMLKAGGFNAVRTSHNPPSEAFLNACDKLGLMVMDESFDCWSVGKTKFDYSVAFNKWWQIDLEAMVKRDRNHPSVVMWSVGNEVPERGTPKAVETARKLVQCVKTIDTTRPVTSAIVENGKDWTLMDPLMAEHDICGYNYHLEIVPGDHKRVPSRVIVVTESYPRDAFANWKLIQNNKFVIGDFVWTAIDYLGESGIGRYYYSGETAGDQWDTDALFPLHGSYCGDIDLIGWRKPISHYRSMLYNNTEKLYMAVREPVRESLEIKETGWSVWPTWESWTWPGFEGKNIQVEVYSKYPKVRLYLNNKLIGEQSTTEEQQFKATFTVPYLAGQIKAVGMKDDKEVESTILKTSGDAAKIKLTVDRKEILANGQDLSHIKIEITDKNGIIQPNAESLLHFKVEGAGTIAGVGNADIRDTDSYFGNTRKAWKGQALVVLKSTRNAGGIKLTVTSPGLSDATFNIKTVSKNKD